MRFLGLANSMCFLPGQSICTRTRARPQTILPNESSARQARVDLLDELAHAIRFTPELKEAALAAKPSLVTWIAQQLRRFSLDKWKQQPEMEGLSRQEALQYLT
jgi:hypothetical protein